MITDAQLFALSIWLLFPHRWLLPEEENDLDKCTNIFLCSIYTKYMLLKEAVPQPDEGLPVKSKMDMLVWKDEDLLLVEVTATGEGAELLLQPAFEAYDFEMTGCTMFQCSGYLPIENFPGFETRHKVRAVRPLIPMVQQASFVISDALKSLHVDKVREVDRSLTGAGLTIGILLDSFNKVGRAVADIASGNLPTNVGIVKEYSGRDGTDEGHSMVQLIYDLVPGANLLF